MIERPASPRPRVTTGCVGLDRMLAGGLVPGYCSVVEGSPGAGKTTLGLQFLVEGALNGEPGVLITFEEFPEQMVQNARAFGWDLHALEREGKIRLLFSDPATFLDGLDQIDGPLSGILEGMGACRLVLDSVTHFERLTEDPSELRLIETRLVHALKREGLTSLLLKEHHKILGGWDRGDNRIAFVADGVILLRYIELESEIRRGLTVLKMRGVAHDRSIRAYTIESEGLRVGDPFRGFVGLLGGSAGRESGAD